MQTERWHDIDRLFAAVLERPPEERARFLAEAAGGDAELQGAVERLLAADRQAGEFLETPMGFRESAEDEVDGRGRRFGPYTLTRLLGQGGMGAVWEAERDDGQFRRRVAVKILRYGPADGELRHRFLAERQILARLEHPDIARLLDGGTTADGHPFLVLEYVEGLPLDVHCERHGLALEARLALFRRICAAVHFAHQNLLVHRDLKPGNILVTADGDPKLIDFGIAKELAPGAADVQTRTGLRVLTPRYASPEQVRGEAVTTASDVYSLGVLLYELLAGVAPYRLDGDSLQELERAVCEQEPRVPSTVAGGRAGARPLRGDLDAIVLMALRKEPERRYGSALELAADLERWERQEPVKARRDSFGYRTGKFLRRHRWSAAAVAVALAALGSLGIGLVREQARASRERDKAQEALDFLIEVFRESDPYETAGERVTARQILDQGTRRIERELAGQPEVQGALMDAMGRVYLGLGLPGPAEPLVQGALARRRAAGDRLAYVASLESLAELRREQGRYAEAYDLYHRVLAQKRRRLGEADPEIAATLGRLGEVCSELQRFEEAEKRLAEALAVARRAPGGGGLSVADALKRLGVLARERARFALADSYFAEALKVERRILGPRDLRVADGLGSLALLRIEQGNLGSAGTLLRDALAVQREKLDGEHPALVESLNNLALVEQYQGRLEAAEKLQREALDKTRRRLGSFHPDVADMVTNLGVTVHRLGQPEPALALYREGLAIRRRVLGEEHIDVAQSLFFIAQVQRVEGRLAEAEETERQGLALARRVLGPEHPKLGYFLVDLGKILLARARPAESEAVLRESLAIRSKALPAGHFDIAWSQSELALCLAAQKRFAEAGELQTAAYQALTAQLPASDVRLQTVHGRLSRLYQAWGKPLPAILSGDRRHPSEGGTR